MDKSFHIIAKSVIGSSHKKLNLECQDVFTHRELEINNNTYRVIAIADGAGSVKYGKKGAEYVTAFVIEYFSNFKKINELTKEDILKLIDEIQYTLNQKEASIINESIREFSCTLLVSILSENVSIFFQVGDGAWIIKLNNVYGVVTSPQKGTYHNETTFVTSALAKENLDFIVIKKKVDLVLGFTDGLENILIFQNAVNEKLVNEIYQTCTNEMGEDNLNIFLNHRLIDNRTDDDRTLCLAYLQE